MSKNAKLTTETKRGPLKIGDKIYDGRKHTHTVTKVFPDTEEVELMPVISIVVLDESVNGSTKPIDD